MLTIQTVRSKLLLLLVGIAVTTVLVACAALLVYDRSSTSETKRVNMSVLSESVAGALYGPTAFGDPESSGYVLKTFAAEPTAQWAAMFTPDGTQLAQWARAEAHGYPERLVLLDSAAKYSEDALEIRRPIEKDGQRVGTLAAYFSVEDLVQRQQRFIWIALGVVAFSSLFAVALAFWGQKFFTRQIANLSQVAAGISQSQDYSARVERVTDDELGQLATSFNEMLEAIGQRDAQLAQHSAQLEITVAERTRDLQQRNESIRLILDNVDQGLAVIEANGHMGPERSASFSRHLGRDVQNTRFSEVLDRVAPGCGKMIDCVLEQAFEGFMPAEVSLDQAPKMIHTTAGRSLQLSLSAIEVESSPLRILAIISDVTDTVRRREQDSRQAQLLSAMHHYRENCAAFLSAVEEANRLVAHATDASTEHAPLLRTLHTLKGNFSILTLQRLADLCHRLESEVIEEHYLQPSSKKRLKQLWAEFRGDLERLVGPMDVPVIQIPRNEFEEVGFAIANSRELSPEIRKTYERWGLEATAPRLRQLEAEAHRMLGSGEHDIDIQLQDSVKYLSPDKSWVWNILPHLVRNAVDHGLRPIIANKSRVPQLQLLVDCVDEQIVFKVKDNGVGINWEKLREKGQAHGLSTTTPQDLIEVLFHDGISTRDQATVTSGHGVGMSAVREIVRQHGTDLEVSSTHNQGTEFSFSIPAHSQVAKAFASAA